nr:Dam family site-specific DNA-(adenine-N6)-methyltransferase [Veillonella ratti]
MAYIDPPYTVTQYISAYHMLETLAKYDNPVIKGVGGKRDRENKNSLYSQRSNAKKIFEDLFRQIQFKHVLVSYSNQGLVPIEELCELASHFAVDGRVEINYFDYQEYQNHRASKKRNGKSLNEVIIYFEKDLSIQKSPINYSGSKDRLVPMLTKILPANIDTFIDVFGGAFNVGANIFALNKVVYNEMNPYLFELVKMLLNSDKNKLINRIELRLREYNLEKGNKEAYEKLRAFYNTNKNPLDLYLLHMYSFQNMIRFNKEHKFNTPVGVAGYSEDIRDRIINFKTKAPNIELLNMDYVNLCWDEFGDNVLFYFDPPYYITSAAYNDGKRGMKGWGINQEIELLSTLKMLDNKGYKFILSNVLKHKERVNTLLLNWIKQNNFKVIDAGVSGWRYAKNEILVINY